MKAVYLASSKFMEESKTADFYQKTANYIGFKVGQKNLKMWEKTPQESTNADMSKVVRVIKRNEKSVRGADVVVADATYGSSGLGFQIALAMTENKQILVIKRRDDNDDITYGPISAGVNKNITYREYDSEEEMTKIIDEFLESARAKIDVKFILIIPSEIDKYLKWASEFRRMHKAQIVRNAVEREMVKDKDWKNYLKQTDL
jgi:hypothetical protein